MPFKIKAKKMKKRPFSVSGKKTGKLPENLFSFSRYEFDGVYIDPYLRKLKQENENNKKTIHKKAFKVVNPRKTEFNISIFIGNNA